MKKMKLYLAIVFITFTALNAFSEETKINKTFPAKEKIRIKTLSGDCEIIKGDMNEIKVSVIHTFDEGDIDIDFDESEGILRCIERIQCHSCSGNSKWIITVPQNTEIDFRSTSGDFILADINGEIEAKTTSGDVEIKNSKGNIDINCTSGDIDAWNLSGNIALNATSGDVYIDDCKAELDVDGASGNITVSDVILTGNSSFSTASGNVKVELAETTKYNVYLGSASGDATLNYNGNEVEGYIEMVCRDDRGRIRCPYEFDDIVYKDVPGNRYSDAYKMETKSFKKGNSTPVIEIKTASGEARLEK